MSGKSSRRSHTIGRDVSKLENVEAPVPRITYDEAVTDGCKKATPKEWWKTNLSGVEISARLMRLTFRRNSIGR